MGNEMTAQQAAERAGVTVTLAERSELPDILRVQHTAFRRIARRFGIDEDVLPPTSETLEDLEARFDRGFSFFAARADGRVVGTVRAELREDGTVEIGRLGVDDGYLRRGVARALMLAVEGSYPEAFRFELFTGAGATEPLALYDQLGYRIYRRRQEHGFELVWLEKPRSGALE